MKTLLVTSIYANLNQTDLGGRQSREAHYKWSLLNLLKLQPTKVVCFTSLGELDELQTWFYETHKVDKELLEFKVYDLYSCDYYDLIQKNKDVGAVKKGDRCHEIQYMKFFWPRLIEDRFSYDRLYWIDAGLSHGGIFPDEYQTGDQWERHFLISLFQPEILNGWNNTSKDKIVFIAKNNTNRYFWSQPLPQQYYNEFCVDKHIVGGMFGGTPTNFDKLANEFESLLLNVLDREDSLYFEELLMSCLYYNHPELITSIDFDDWYYRDEWKDEYEFEPKLFYHLFL